MPAIYITGMYINCEGYYLGLIHSSGLRYLGLEPTTIVTTNNTLPIPSSSSDSPALPINCPNFTSWSLLTVTPVRL